MYEQGSSLHGCLIRSMTKLARETPRPAKSMERAETPDRDEALRSVIDFGSDCATTSAPYSVCSTPANLTSLPSTSTTLYRLDFLLYNRTPLAMTEVAASAPQPGPSPAAVSFTGHNSYLTSLMRPRESSVRQQNGRARYSRPTSHPPPLSNIPPPPLSR